jgi:hypothetical protein
MSRISRRRSAVRDARRAKVAEILSDPGSVRLNCSDIAKITGVAVGTAWKDVAEVKRAWRATLPELAARGREVLLNRLEDIDADAKDDRDHGARVRVALGQAKILGIDRPPLLTVEEQRAGWADFLATLNAVVERHLSGEALDAFRDDLRATLAPMMGPPGRAGSP